MNQTIYLEYEFWGLLVCTIILPAGIFVWMTWKRKFSRTTLLMIGTLLVFLSGLDAIFLQRLSAKAKASANLLDDRIFASEISITLYIIPLILAGIGVNLLSHVLCEHLTIAELDHNKRANEETTCSPQPDGGDS